VCVYFFGTHDLGLVLLDKIVHAKHYREQPTSKKKSKKTCPKFAQAVKELDDYVKGWTPRKTSKAVSQGSPIFMAKPDVTPSSQIHKLSVKESPLHRLFYNGKLAGMHIKRKEISLSEVASNERAEAEFEALVINHCKSISSSASTATPRDTSKGKVAKSKISKSVKEISR